MILGEGEGGDILSFSVKLRKRERGKFVYSLRILEKIYLVIKRISSVLIIFKFFKVLERE